MLAGFAETGISGIGVSHIRACRCAFPLDTVSNWGMLDSTVMTPTSHIVTADAVRPARPDGTCFYCRAPLGDEHITGCVLRRKTFVVDFTIRTVLTLSEDWDPKAIDFRYNDSSWCASNLLNQLKSVDTDERCLCDRTTGKFVRDATADDEARYGVCE